MGLKQPFFHASVALLTTSDAWMSPFNADWDGYSIADGFVSQPLPNVTSHSVTIRHWKIRLGTAPGAGKSRTFTLYTGGFAGTPTALTITISGTDTTGSDLTHAVVITPGQHTYIRATSSGSPALCTLQSVFEVEHADDVSSTYGWGGGQWPTTNQLGTSTVYDSPLSGGGSQWLSTEAAGRTLVAVPGTITQLSVGLSAAPGGTATRIFTIVLDGVAQDGSGGTVDTRCTVLSGVSSGHASFTLPVLPLQTVSVRHTVSGSPAAAVARGSTRFVATTPGQVNFVFRVTDAPAGSSTEYNFPLGRNWASSDWPWTATEAAREFLGPVTTIVLHGMYVEVASAPGAGVSQTYTLRLNAGGGGGADTVQTVTVTGPSAVAGPSVAAGVSITDSDRFANKCVAEATGGLVAPMIIYTLGDPTVLPPLTWLPKTVAINDPRWGAVPSGCVPPGAG